MRYDPCRLLTRERYACNPTIRAIRAISWVFVAGEAGAGEVGTPRELSRCAFWALLFVRSRDLSRRQHHPVGCGVVGELHRAHGPFGLHRFLESELALGRDRGGTCEVSQHFAQPTGEEEHLRLFQF
jgi:hypothetical protein